jgi:RHS repeat-associated protein
MHPEGRTRYAKRYWQNGDSAYRWEWDYFYKDHLGNIRTTVTEQRDTANYKASMEPGQNAKETAMFKRVAETRMLISGVNGHPPPDALTNPNQYTSAIGFDHTHSYGPTTTLKVMAGDTIQIGTKVWLKPRPAFPFDPYGDYEGVDMGNWEWMFTALMPMVSGQLAGLSGKVTAGQLTSNGSWAMLYRSILGRALYDHQAHTYYNRDIYKPAVGFNYILLDEQFNYVPEGSGFMDAENNATLQTLATGLMVVKKSGYLTVTTTVGTPSFNAYFDNLSILHRSGPLLQESDTYAFGGGIDALESRSFGRAENKYGYNGKEKQPDLGLEWLDYGARMYDAQVGRWGVVDPKADKYFNWTPYNYVANNPIKLIDPDGKEWVDAKGNLIYKDGNYTEFASGNDKKMGNELLNTIKGAEQFNKLVNSSQKIKIKFDKETKLLDDEGKPVAGLTVPISDITFDLNTKTKDANVTSAEITLFEYGIDFVMEGAKTNKPPDYSITKNMSFLDVIAVILGHEIEHTTNDNVNIKTNKGKAAAEDKAREVSDIISDQILQNKEKAKKQ